MNFKRHKSIQSQINTAKIKARVFFDDLWRSQSGASLIAVAIFVMVLGLMAAPAFKLYMHRDMLQRVDHTENTVVSVQEALDRFIEDNGRLPCPATFTDGPASPNFGVEISNNCAGVPNPAAGSGTFRAAGADGQNVHIGTIPVRTLNLPDDAMLDAWGHRITYAVTEVFASPGADMDSDLGDIELLGDGDQSSAASPNSIIYLVVSQGPDTRGAYTLAGIEKEACPAGGLAAENCDRNDAVFRQSVQSKSQTGSNNAGANTFTHNVAFMASSQQFVWWSTDWDFSDCINSNRCNLNSRKTRQAFCLPAENFPPADAADAAANNAPGRCFGPGPSTDEPCDGCWNVGDYGACDVPCNGGTQTRLVTCVGDCTNAGAAPGTTQSCNIANCTWTPTGWTSCTASCGGGTQTQIGNCLNPNDSNNLVNNRWCSSLIGSQACNTFACFSGVCGGPNGDYLASAPTSNLCSLGTPTSVTGSGPWNWTCMGNNTATTADDTPCSANLLQAGSCGAADGTAAASAPTSGLCSSGSATSVSGSGPWNWTCEGNDTSTSSDDDTCSAPSACSWDDAGRHDWDTCAGIGGSVNPFDSYDSCTPFPSSPTPGMRCADEVNVQPSSCAGESIETYQVYVYDCGGGVSVPPTATVTSGSCGAADGSATSSAPTTGLCSAGTASSVTGSGPWNWTCSGSNNATNLDDDTCSAPVASTNCPASTLSWSVGGNTCSANVNLTADGSADTANDTTAPTTGSATFQCNGTTWNATPNPGATCNAACSHVWSYSYSTQMTDGQWNTNCGSQDPDIAGNSCTSGEPDRRICGDVPFYYHYECQCGSPSFPPTVTRGRCGAADSTATSSAPTSGLCSSGSATTVTGSGPWSWTCEGSVAASSADDDTCSAPIAAPPPSGCEASGGTTVTVTSTTTDYFCNCPGPGPDIYMADPLTFTCPAPVVNGSCGAADGTATSTTPTSGLCSAGTATAATGSGPWSWTCEGSVAASSADDDTCSAPVASLTCSIRRVGMIGNHNPPRGGAAYRFSTWEYTLSNGTTGTCTTRSNTTNTDCPSVCPTTRPSPPPAAGCPATSRTWTVSGNSCTGNISAASNAQNRTANDSTAPTTGSATFTCNAGSWTQNPGATCNAPVARNGECGSARYSCNVGSAFNTGYNRGSNRYTWWCSGENGGARAPGTCTAPGVTCGSANGRAVSSRPTSGLCSFGSNTAVSGSGPWTWTCRGHNSRINASLGANADDRSCSAPVLSTGCSATSRTWTVSGNTCSGNVSAASNAQNRTATDSSGPTLGSADFRCNSGSWTQQPGATCATLPTSFHCWRDTGRNSPLAPTRDSCAPCDASTRSTCQRAGFTDIYECVSWATNPGGLFCPGTPPPTSPGCSATSRAWTVGGNTCTGNVSAASNAQNRTATDSTAPTTGSASFRCNAGGWQQRPGATCNAAPAAAGCPGFNDNNYIITGYGVWSVSCSVGRPGYSGVVSGGCCRKRGPGPVGCVTRVSRFSGCTCNPDGTYTIDERELRSCR